MPPAVVARGITLNLAALGIVIVRLVAAAGVHACKQPRGRGIERSGGRSLEGEVRAKAAHCDKAIVIVVLSPYGIARPGRRNGRQGVAATVVFVS